MDSNKLFNFFKEVYSRNAYIFLGINAISLIIIFFVLSHEAGGGFLMRIFSFLFCVLIGGGLMAYWAKKKGESPVVPFRRGASILLVFFVGLAWMNDGYKSTYGGSTGSYDYPKACKAGCGYEITSSTYDCEGYHCTCVPNKDGDSFYDKARNY